MQIIQNQEKMKICTSRLDIIEEATCGGRKAYIVYNLFEVKCKDLFTTMYLVACLCNVT